MQKIPRLALLILVGILSLGLGSAQQATGANQQTDEDTAAAEALIQQWVDLYSQGDIAAVSGLYTEDAIFFNTAGVAFEGREAIQGLVQGIYDAGLTEITVETTEIEMTGDVGHTVGRYTFFNAEGTAVAEGRYMIIYRRINDEWRIYRHMSQRIEPPAEEGEGGETGGGETGGETGSGETGGGETGGGETGGG